MPDKKTFIALFIIIFIIPSCGIIRISVNGSQGYKNLIDFSDTNTYEVTIPEDDCYGKAYEGGCPCNIDPVCGCNGITYGNSCQARLAGVKHWVKGKCQ